jgi:very-short-patch-repair endonuclease
VREQRADQELRLAALAARQHGVVAVDQLRAIGIGPNATTRRLRCGRLHRLHRGVYAVGHRGLSREGGWLAAVLACGEGAALSHRSAAALWELLGPPPGAVDVTVPGSGGRRPRRGIRMHRSASLVPAMVTRRRAIPVTTPARTIADLRGVVPGRVWRSAVRQAELRGLALDAGVEPDGTRSELERRFLALCRRHRLPPPETNVRIGPFEVDFLWRERRLIAELDGFAYHRTRTDFEADRERDARLKVLGYEVVRFTYRRVFDEPAAVIGTVRALLD